MADEKCPCDSVVQLRTDFNEKFKVVEQRQSSYETKSQVLEIKFATIDTKLNMIIGGVTILAIAVAAVVVPMIF